MSKKEIPTIDLSPLWGANQNGLDKLVNQIHDAYSTIGFARLINHNISSNLTNRVFEQSKIFHNLPIDEKMKIKQNNCFRGYMPLNASQLKVSSEGRAKKPNQLESFIMAFDPNKEDEFYKNGLYFNGDNQFLDIPNFKSTLEEYRDKSLELCHQLVQLFMSSLGMDKNCLSDMFKDPTFFLRLQYYPVQPRFIPDDQFGIAPHTDYGFCTLLNLDDTAGLQVRTQENDWIDVPYQKDSLILNTGDMLSRMSNGKIISTPHRVINRSNKARYSIPFFFEPNMKAKVKILSSCLNKGDDNKEIMYGDYLMERIRGNYNIGSAATNEK
jgi:isopenicillin N synthase-like dioxygenase